MEAHTWAPTYSAASRRLSGRNAPAARQELSHLNGSGWGKGGSRHQSTFWAKGTTGAQVLGCRDQVSWRKWKKSKMALAQSILRRNTEMRPAGLESDYCSPFRSKWIWYLIIMGNGKLLSLGVTWLYLQVRKTALPVVGWTEGGGQRVDFRAHTAVIRARANGRPE